MARKLSYFGLAVLVATAGLMIGSEAGVLPGNVVDPLLRPGLALGALLLIGGMLIGLIAPLGRAFRGGRCVRCGRRIERGQTYCLDHLQETLNEYRDQARDGARGR